ncbi:MAG: pyrrolysine--tRNA(Pyl) ligase small subunit [Defluviitaleaceae bacterium]|nr:pyrrolysine--tRNA(Pyl) ligase small subunit [Defluviitaleaceae bacterium]MCL2836624.1 pyrrolysine--tRNA(Pyl) ligase small subunit [Defluviitaleaceae bacterium]
MEAKKTYYRKNVFLFDLVTKMKLWPSKSGALHGVREMEVRGDFAKITTHCGEVFIARDSRNSRAARWLRNKWAKKPCPICKTPEWKLKKYNQTVFSSSYGSDLTATREKRDILQ